MFVAGRDGRTANAEHRRQHQRHIYVVYVTPHAPCPLFGMSAMFRAMAAEVRWVLICTSIFQGCWGPKFISQALDLLFGCIFLHATWVGLCLGVLNPVFQLRRVSVWPLSLYLTSWYKFVLWGGGISILELRWLLPSWPFLLLSGVGGVTSPDQNSQHLCIVPFLNGVEGTAPCVEEVISYYVVK